MDSITYETKYYSLPPAMRIIFDKIDEIVRSQTKLKAEISSIIEQTNSYDTSAAEKTKCCLKRLKTKTDQLLPVIDFLSSQINTSIAVIFDFFKIFNF